jgi:peptidoglycan-associated lipoprotein
MMRRTFYIALLCCLSAFFMTGCGKKQVSLQEISDSRKPEGRLIEGAGSQDVSETDGKFSEGDLESLDRSGEGLVFGNTSDEHKQKYGRSTAPLLPVYFDFDSASISTTQFDNLNENGQYLLGHKSSQVVIEGNCDERGTNDYNLALGEMRALNVKKYLMHLGVEPGRMTTVSYGSQHPLFLGSDEQSWAGNRRVDLVLP